MNVTIEATLKLRPYDGTMCVSNENQNK